MNLKNLPKPQIIEFWKYFTHDTHSEVFNKVCKYGIDPVSIVEDTERTQFCPDGQMDRLTDGGTDGQGETSISPSTSLSWVYNY